MVCVSAGKMRDIINFNTDCAIVFHACPPGRLFFLYAEKKWGRLREGAESYAKALASDILR
nr:hypothetical protein pEC013_00036 [Escherichia coli]